MRFQSQPSIKGFLTTYGNPATGILVKPADKHGRGKAETCYPCTRCGGAGGSSKWHHTGWTCFNCGGSGRGGDKIDIIYTPEAFAKLEAQRAVRNAKKEAVAKAKAAEVEAARVANLDSNLIAFRAVEPQLAIDLAPYADQEVTEQNRFLVSIAKQLFSTGDLTPSQIESAKSVIARNDALLLKKLNSRALGAVGDVIEVTVTCKKMIDFSYGSFPTIYRFLVILETADGQTIKYIGNADAIPYRAGESASIKAKIKAVEIYNDITQTVIERPRAIKADTK